MSAQTKDDSATVAAPSLVDVMCECVHMDCTEHVSMAPEAYEALRRFPTHFVVKAGHEVAEGERIVSDAAEYIVVEKNARDDVYGVTVDHTRRPNHDDAAVGA